MSLDFFWEIQNNLSTWKSYFFDFLEKTFPLDFCPEVYAVILKMAVQHLSIKQVLMISVRSAGQIKIGSFKMQRKNSEECSYSYVYLGIHLKRPSDWNLLGSKNKQKKEKIINFKGCCAREKFEMKVLIFTIIIVIRTSCIKVLL